jgi:uncharacterized oxidoreductase
MSRNTILITGGTSGIGYALASQLVKQKNIVLITGRTEERLAAARKALPGLYSFVCDQSDPDAIRRLCADVTSQFPRLNILINNAGIGLRRNLNKPDVPLEALEQEISTNLTGPIQLIQALLPLLKQQDQSLIVNVTSGLAFAPMPLKPIYCATKAAMHSYTQSLRVQLTHSSVRVVELAPPATKTAFNKGQEEMNSAALMDVNELARVSIRGLERDRDEILPGASPILRLIGRLNPGATIRRADAERMGLQG